MTQKFHAALILGLSLLIPAWAGREFPAKPGEAVQPGELIVGLKPGAASSIVQNYLPGAQVIPLGHQNLHLIRAGSLASGVAAQLAADGLVEFVEPNRIRTTAVQNPSDTSYGSQWALNNIQALQAWSVLPNRYLTSATAGTQRLKVAVLDTGADCTHPDFMNAGGTSTDAAQGGQLLWSASQAPEPTAIVSPACSWQDDYGHGTHVTGILAAATNNAAGIAGVGYPLQVMVYKVLDSTGSGSDAVVANAIMSATDAGAQVISLSLGGAGYSQSMQLAVNYAWQRNVVVVAAAGNSSNSALFFPADANYVVSVSASDSNNQLASFSNFGNGIDLAAPGVNILSTAPTYSLSTGWLNYVSLSGTSMAAPHVSAVAGLVSMTTPGTSAAAILQRMQQTATSTAVGGGWGPNLGYGVVNAFRAVAGPLRTATNGGVTGQVIDRSGAPVNSATVTVNGSSITTDSTGLFRFGTFSAGTYPVAASAAGFPNQNLTVTVAPGADTTLTLIMGASYGKFTGSVTNRSLAAPGAVVQALSGGLISATTVADASGQYTLWVPAGTYDLLVTAIGNANATVTGRTVASGGATSVNLVTPRLGSITGLVTDGGGTPVVNAQLAVAGPSAAGAVTDSTGHYSTIGLPTGTYTVTCTATGLLATTINGVAVALDTVTNQNIQMTTPAVVAPAFSPGGGSYSSAQAVTIGTATAGASIRYTTDGSTPTSTIGTVYSGPVTVGSTQTIRAIAYKAGFTDSPVTSATYTIAIPTSSPAFSPAGGSYSSVQTVTISTATAGASIRYTTDGSTPTSTVGTVYSGPITVGSTQTINAIAYKAGFTDSPVTSATYTIAIPTSSPAFSPAGGSYSSAQTVTISTATAGASIRFTTDGSTPTSTFGTVYSGPITVGSTQTIRAIAYKAWLADSPVTSAAYTIATSGNSALFVRTDTTTQGTWRGVYGANGYNVINDTTAYPAYATVTPSNQLTYMWNGSTTDVRGLQKALQTDRIAATWYNSAPFSIDVNINDGLTHQIALYCVDWDSGGIRAQTIDVLDGNTNAVLDSRSLSRFSNGQYVVWKVSGHVILRIANTSTWNGVVSGIFFDAPASTTSANRALFVRTDTTTQGTWRGTYGANGYNVINDTTAYPAYATVTPSNQLTYMWNGSTTDVRGLQKALQTDRIAATWYNWAPFSIDVNINDGLTHQIALYCVDWDGGGIRAQTIDVLDGNTNAVLDSRSLTRFSNGQYVVWKVSGHVILRITNTSTWNGVVSGIFFDAPAPTTVANSALFVRTDITTQGTWRGTYGANGYNVINDTTAYPAYATVTPSNQLTYMWNGSTTDVRGLQKALQTDRIAATWYNWAPFSIDVNINDGLTHQIALYCVDWDGGGIRRKPSMSWMETPTRCWTAAA